MKILQKLRWRYRDMRFNVWIYNMKRKNRKHNRKHERWRKRTQYNEEARLAWERAVERYALTSE